MLILLDGSKGAGKSTVGNLIVQKLPKTIFLSLDVERRALTDQAGTRAELNKRAFEEVVIKTKEALAHSKNVIIDCGLTPERVEQFESLAKTTQTPLHKFLLKASYETLLNRVRGRDASRGNPTDVPRFDEVYKIVHEKDFTGFKVIETDDKTPDQIAGLILNNP